MRVVGSIIFIGFYQYIAEFLPPGANTLVSIDKARQYKLKEYEYQFDRYAGKVQAGVKLYGDVCMAIDVLDQEALEGYFLEPKRFLELKSVVFKVVDKLYELIDEYDSSSTVLYDLINMPNDEYPHHSIEQFESYIRTKNLNYGKEVK